MIASQLAVTDYERRYGILNLLAHLERECGGHGNGLVFCRDRKLFGLKKGLDLSVETIYDDIMSYNFDYVLFHTRIASVSSRLDENCHPFAHENSALAMNGTEHGLANAASAVNRTDSELIFDLVKDKNINYTSKILTSFDSAFVGFCEGKPYAFKNYGALCEYLIEDFFFASSFPEGVSCKELGYKFSFKNFKRNCYTSSDKTKTSSFTSRDFFNYQFKQPEIFSHNEDDTWEEAYVEGYREGYRDGSKKERHVYE